MNNLTWLKWQVGVAGALSIFVFFTGIKASPAFKQAYLAAASSNNHATPQIQNSGINEQYSEGQNQKDPASEDQSGFVEATPGSFGQGNTSHRQEDNSQFNSSDQNSSNSFTQTPSSGPHTRTRRS